MAQTSILIAGLTCVSKFVDSFYVVVYSDAGLTISVGGGVSGVNWDGAHSVQSDIITVPALNFGTTYYVKAGARCSVSSQVTYCAAYAVNTGTPSAPVVTYGGTFQSTTAGVNFYVTPTTSATDIDHYEGLYVVNNPTVTPGPSPSTAPMKLLGGQFTWTAGGNPGDSVRAWVRSVSTSGAKQPWQSLGTFTVATTWTGNMSGTLQDHSIIGTGGVPIISNNSGTIAWNGSPVAGMGISQMIGGSSGVYNNGSAGFLANNYGSGGNSYQLTSDSTGFQLHNASVGGTPISVNSSGYVGVGGSPSDPFQIFNANNAYATGNANAAWVLNATGAGSTGQLYSMGNAAGVYALSNQSIGATNFQLGPNSTFGLNSSPGSNVIGIQVANSALGYQPIITGSGNTGLAMNNTAGGGNLWFNYSGNSGTNYVFNSNAGVNSIQLTSSGLGLNTYPSSPFNVNQGGGGQPSVAGAASPGWGINNSAVGNSWVNYVNGSGQYGTYNGTTATNPLLIGLSNNSFGINTVPSGQVITIQMGSLSHPVIANSSGDAGIYMNASSGASFIPYTSGGTSNFMIYNSGNGSVPFQANQSSHIGFQQSPGSYAIGYGGTPLFDSTGRLYSTKNVPPSNAGMGISITVPSGSSGSTMISCRASTVYVGSGSYGYNSGSVNPGSYDSYYVYVQDPTYSGGSVTYNVTFDFNVVFNNDANLYMGAIETFASGAPFVGRGGTRACTVRGTQITLPSDVTAPVETLKANDLVKTKYGAAEIDWIMEVPDQDIYRIELVNGMVLECSGSHTLMVWGLWTEVSLISLENSRWPGRARLSIDSEDEVSEILSIEVVRKDSVWMMHLKEHHSYVAGGMWSHNVAKPTQQFNGT